MSRKTKRDQAVRSNISLHPLVREWANKLMRQHGCTTFSDLVAHLVRTEYWQMEARAAAVIQGQGQGQG